MTEMEKGPSWDFVIKTSERLASIEAKLDMALANHAVVEAKIEALDSRQSALEMGRQANMADLEALRNQIAALEMQKYELTPASFSEWKKGVDLVINAYQNNKLIMQTEQEIRLRDKVMITGLAGAGASLIAAIIGALARIYL